MNWKVFFAFIAGGITGGLGTWYGIREHYQKEAKEEISAMNDWYREKLKEVESTRTVVVDGVTDENKKDVETFLKENTFGVVASENSPKSTEKRDDTLAKKQYESLVRQYDKMYKEKPSLESLKASMEHPEDDDEINTEDYVEFVGETEESVECVREPHPDTLPGPVIIPEDEFANDWRFEKCTIMYYIGDDTLADEDDTIMDDIENTVSREALRVLVDEDLDAVYVRNEKLGIDYEITSNERKYSEEVLGFFDEDEVGGRVPMKKRKEKPSNDE